MKKWLRSLGVYALGVATIPAVLLIGSVTSANLWSRPHAPKFVNSATWKVDQGETTAADTQFVGFTGSDDASGDRFAEEPLMLAENSPRSGGAKPPFRELTTNDLDLTLEEPASVRPQIVPRKNAAPLPNDGIDSLAEQTVSDEQKAKLTALRDKLSDLIKAKAELINEQTLTNEITTIEKQISDLHAAQKLLNAQQILKQLIEEFPQSPAAQKGQRMLDAAGVPKLSTSKLEPIPEPQRVSAIEPF